MNGSTVRRFLRHGYLFGTKDLLIVPSTNRICYNYSLENSYGSSKSLQTHQQYSFVLGLIPHKRWKQHGNSLTTIQQRYFSTTLPVHGQTVLKPKSPEPNDKRREPKEKGKTIAANKIETQPKTDVEPKAEKTVISEQSDIDVQSDEKLSLTGKLKKMYKEYWYVLLPVHIFTSTFWFAGFYYMSTSGVDIPALLESMHFSDAIISKLRDSSLGHAAIAYLCYKIATPLRYTVTLGGSTLSIKYLSQLGYIRPVPSKAQIKQMYDDQKAKFKKNG